MKFDDPVKLGFQGFEEQGAERMSAGVLQREVKNGEDEDPSWKMKPKRDLARQVVRIF